MRILLINPPTNNIITTEIPKIVRENSGTFPPLGLMYIQSYLYQEIGIKPKILDLKLTPLRKKYFKKYIVKFRPEIVGVTAFTHNLVDVLKILGVFKNIDNDIITVLGGPHTRNFPTLSLSSPQVDYIIIGEAEIAFAELVKSISKNQNPVIKGIRFKNGSDIVGSTEINIVEDIDNLPFPNRKEVSYKKYSTIMGGNSTMTTVVTSRGCPYNCKYCDSSNIPFRLRSPKNVLKEIEQCQELGIEHIYFLDDTFNFDYERTYEICEGILKRDCDFNWSCRAVVNDINEELLKIMKEAGCKRIHFGIEADKNKDLREIGKNITISKVKEVFYIAKKMGIETVGYFMIGLPSHRFHSDIVDLIKFSNSLDPTYAMFNIFEPYPNTELYKIGTERGILDKNKWKRFAQNPDPSFIPEFWEEYFDREVLFSLLDECYKKFYFRPSKILEFVSKNNSMRNFLKKIKTAAKLIF